jgi:NAD+ synthase (glutamine-hydrolysing)
VDATGRPDKDTTGRPDEGAAIRPGQGASREPGGLRVMLAALCCQKGDGEANLAAHREILCRAREEKCHLAVFPEMSLSGSLDPRSDPGALLRLDSGPVRSLAQATDEHAVAAIFGIAEHGEDGASYITQVYACHGQLAGAYRKRHLGEDEDGYAPGTQGAVFQLGALRFGIAICAEGGVDYPFDEPAAAGAQIIFFCAAPGLYGRRTGEDSWRSGHAWWETCGLGAARRHAARTGAWVALTTQAGSAQDEDFPGLAALVDPAGQVVARLPDWREGTLVVDLPLNVAAGPLADIDRRPALSRPPLRG